MVLGALSLGGYDITVQFDQNILQATSVSLGHSAFDLNNNGIITDDPLVCPINDLFNTIGVIRELCALTGGNSVAGFPTAAIAYKINFQVNNPLMGTASELPSAMTPMLSTVVSFNADGETTVIPHNDIAGYFTPGNSLALRSTGCKANIQGFNVKAHGFTDIISCRVVNNGVGTVLGSATFNWVSLGGQPPGSSSSTSSTLAAGQNAEYDSSITLPPGVASNDIYIVTGTLVTTVMFPDGTTFGPILGPQQTFNIIVNG